MVVGNSNQTKSRRREFRSNYSVESFTSESSSDGEINSRRNSLSFSGTRKYDHLQRTKSFHQLMNEMSSSTRKLEEETTGLLRDLVRFFCRKDDSSESWPDSTSF